MQENNNYSLYVKTYPEDIVLNAVCTLLHFPPNYLGRYYQLHFTSKEIEVQEEYTIYKKKFKCLCYGSNSCLFDSKITYNATKCKNLK